MKKQTKPLRFCLIGEDNLLLECADHLIKKSYKIIAIFSDHYKAAEWCRKYHVTYYASHETNQMKTVVDEFDYLLSISNPHILSAESLAAPKIKAINYHNALLPNYAGSNATAWAILNNETSHGITWHIMTTDIDEGPILYQKTLPILENDTAISLNIRCHQLTKTTFPDFIDQLVNNKLIPLKNNVLTKYKSSKKPEHNGFIHWEMPADLIYRIFRGLTLGSYTNSLATPKFVLKQQSFIIEDLELTHRVEEKKAGSIIRIDDGLWIHTSTSAIKLKKIRLLSGKPITILEFISQQGLSVGDSISNKKEEIKQFVEASKRNANSEYFWKSEWSCCSPLLLFPQNTINESFIKNQSEISTQNTIEEVFFDDLRIKELKQNFSKPCQLFLTTAIVIYLYRQNQYQPISFLLHKDTMENLLYSLDHCKKTLSRSKKTDFNLYEDYYLVNIELSQDFTYEETEHLLVGKLKSLSQRGLCLRDFFTRHPVLEQKIISNLACITSFNEHMTQYYWEQNNKPIPLITFFLSEKENRISVSTQIDKKHCDIEYATLIKKHLNSLICSLQDQMNNKISKLSLLSKEEKKILSIQLSRKTDLTAEGESLLSIFHKQVKKHPSKIAVQDRNRALTYQELDQQSNTLAHHLAQYNPSLGSGICFLLPADVNAVITVLAILKQGCYYVPIPEGYSADLIRKVIKENDSSLLIINSTSKLDSLKKSGNFDKESFKLIHIEELSSSTLVSFSNKKTQKTHSSALAYVMYTSGSTGLAKGVMIHQTSVINLVKDQSVFKIDATDNIGHSSSMAFDASTFLMWTALLKSATLTLIDKTTLMDDKRFSLFVRDYEINVLLLPVRLFDRLVDKDCTLLSKLKILIVGGDAMTVETTNKAISYLKETNCLLINAYGPTENTTVTTFYKIDKEKKYHYRIPIGQPLNNISVYVLDKFYNPLPAGMIGELYISGKSLSLGYVKNEELTHKKFLRKIESLNTGRIETYYQTGDLVFWSAKGDLEYIGRIDDQVKIRGYRIDLNRLTDTLLKHQLVKEAYISVKTENNIKNMIAYILPKKSNEIPYIRVLLWSYIKEKLPNFMWPQHIFFVKRIPLNSSGKVDNKRIAYEKYDIQYTVSDTSRLPQSNSTLKKLFDIWSRVLGHAEFSEKDNFFTIGGHSLNLAVILMEIEKQFSIKLSVTDFLTSPTIQELFPLIDASKDNKLNTRNEGQIKTNIAHLIQRDLNYKIVSKKTSIIKETKKTLITGVSGFLGKYLLKTLLKQTDHHFYCLVRNAGQLSSRSFLDRLFFNDFFDTDYCNRVHIVSGDLLKAQLGMNKDDFEFIENNIDTLYHLAASVNHLYDYATLQLANVEATKQMIELASTGILKKIVYISSMSATVPTKENKVTESLPDCPDDIKQIADGYSQTKWMSEYFLNKAKKKDIPIKVIRSGWILSDEEVEEIPPENHLLSLVNLCIRLGVAPNWSCNLRFLPVNFVAEAIARISDDTMNHYCYNLTHPHGISWKELIKYLNTQGCSIIVVPIKDWINNSIFYLPKDDPFSPFSLLYRDEHQARAKGPDLSYPIVQNNTITRLAAVNLAFPEISDPVLRRVFLRKDLFLSFDNATKIRFPSKENFFTSSTTTS